MKKTPINFLRKLFGILFLLPFFSTNAFPLEWKGFFERLPHFTIPCSLAEKGHILTTDFKAGGNLNKTYGYTFYLSFLTKDSPEELRQRVAGFLGFREPKNGSTYTDANGQIVYNRTGIPIPIRLTISRLDGESETVVYNQEFRQLWTLAYGASYDKAIDVIRLEPARYRVRLETLAAVPELADVPVSFEIGLPGKH